MKFFIFKRYKYKEVLGMWLNSKNNIKIQSYQKYENLINSFFNNDLGNTFIKKITNQNIENFFSNLINKNTAISTQKTLFYIVKSSFEYAHKKKMCSYMNLEKIKIKNKPKTIHILSREEQNILENHLKENINIRKACLLLCLYTGLRIGEVCGLKWDDIHFETKSLEVKRTIERIKNNDKEIKAKTILIASTPKSDTSKRIIPIPDFLIEILKKFKGENNNYILSNSEKLYDPRQFESFYERILKKNNIRHIHFHTLRHTFATRSIESKMDIKTLSEILGHSSIEITLKLYVHPSYELKKDSIENLVQFMTTL